MNVVRINSSPFKGEVGRGMGLPGGYFVDQTAVRAHPHPIPPLEGEGERVHAIALRFQHNPGRYLERTFILSISSCHRLA